MILIKLKKVKKFRKKIQPWHLVGFSMETVFWFLKTTFSLIFNGNCFLFFFSFEKIICSENQCNIEWYIPDSCVSAPYLQHLKIWTLNSKNKRVRAISRHPISFLKKHFRFALIFRTNDFFERKEKRQNSFHWKSMKMRFLKIKKKFPLKTRPNAKAEFFSDFF